MTEIVDRETEVDCAAAGGPSLGQANSPEPLVVNRLLSAVAFPAMAEAMDVLGGAYAQDSALGRVVQMSQHTREALKRFPSLDSASAAVAGNAWSSSSGRMRSIQDFALASNEAMKAIRGVAKAWSPVWEGMSSGIQELGRSAEIWQRRLSLVGESLVQIQREVNAVSAPVRSAVMEMHDRLRVVQAVVQSPAFQAWAEELSNERVQDGLHRLLEKAHAEDGELAFDTTATLSEQREVGTVEDVRLVAWIASLLRRINALGVTASDRWQIITLLVTFALFTYSEMGSDADHAELLSTIRQQHQENMARGAQQDQDAKDFVAAIHALVSLQQVDQRYEISVDAAPMRNDWSGPVARRLERGEEVQVLAAAGKWRQVQGVDEEGALFIGWVMNKHLREALPPSARLGTGD